MEATDKELRERYETLDTDELVDLYRNSDLTELAQSVLKETLGKRGVDSDAFQEQTTKIVKPINLFISKEVTFSIDPKEHMVLNPSRGIKSAVPEALYSIGITIVAVIGLLFIFAIFGKFMPGPTSEETISTVMAFLLLSSLVGTFFIIKRKIYFILGYKLSKLNQKSPKSAVESFFSLLGDEFYEQAYNHLLTDTAQNQENLDLPSPSFLLME